MKKHFLICLLAVLNIAIAANTATAQTYSYIDEAGVSQTASSATKIDGTITSSLSAGWYYVSSATDFTGDLAISGDVNLILDKDLTISDGNIEIPSGSSLTIYGTTENLYTQATLTADDIKGDGTLTINSCLKVNTDDIGSDAAIISILGGQVTAENIKAANLTLGYKSMDDQIVCKSISANAITIAEGCSYQLDGNTYSGALPQSEITNFCDYVNSNTYVGIGMTSEVFVVDNFSYTILDEGERTVQVSGWAGATAPENIEIPSSVEYNGTAYTVTKIGGNAFCYPSTVYDKIHKVTIPGSIVEIKEYAFSNSSLEIVEVEGNALKIIGDYAFYYTQVKEITLPASIEFIGKEAFENSDNGEGFTIYCNADEPPAVGENAFHKYGYSGKRYLYIPPCANYSNVAVWSDYFGSNIYGFVPFDEDRLSGDYDKDFDGTVAVPGFTETSLTPADGVTMTFTKLEFTNPNVEKDNEGGIAPKTLNAYYNITVAANETCNSTGTKIKLKNTTAKINPHEITQDEIESVIQSRRATADPENYDAYATAGHYSGDGQLDGSSTIAILYPENPAKTVYLHDLKAYYVADEASTEKVSATDDAKYIHVDTETASCQDENNYKLASSYDNFEGAIGVFHPYVELADDGTKLIFKYGVLPDPEEVTYYTLPTMVNAVPLWDDATNKAKVVSVEFDPSFKDAAPTSCLQWFYYFQQLTTIEHIEYLNTANVTRMDGMFYNCSALERLDVSHFDTRNVTNMSNLFNACKLLETIDVSHFNTEKVTTMEAMFRDCEKVEVLNVSGFDTRLVTSMSNMFRECYALSTLDVSGFNTGSVTDMSSMFYRCGNNTLNALDVSRFDTRKVKNMAFMFNSCNQSNLDVRGFVTDQVTRMDYMFTNYNGTSLDVSSFVTDNVTRMDYMFSGCKNLTSLDLSSFNTGNVENMHSMFGYSYADNNGITEGNNLTSINFGDNFNTEKVTDMAYMFFGCKKLESLDLGDKFNTGIVTNMSNMFDQCSSLTTLDLSKFKTETVTTMPRMFFNCTSLKKIYVTEGLWTNAGVTSGYQVFSGDTKLVGDNGTTYDPNNVNYLYARIDDPANGNPGYLTAAKEAYAVYSSGTLTFKCGDRNSEPATSYTFDLPTDNTNAPDWLTTWATSITKVVFDPSFDYARPVTCYKWFSGCTELTEITGMEYLHTDKVTDMSYMFINCKSLQLVDLSQFNTSNVTTMQSMFAGCYEMRMLNLTSFNTAKVTDMKAMFSMSTNGWPTTGLTAIYVGAGWNVDQVTSSDYMFDDCTVLIGGKGTTYNSSYENISRAKVDGGTSDPGYLTDISNYGYAELKEGTLTFKQGMMPAKSDGVEYYELAQVYMKYDEYDEEGNKTSWSEYKPSWFKKRKTISNVTFESGFNSVIIRSCKDWFRDFTMESITGLTNLNTSEVTEMQYMFYDCANLKSIDLSNFNTNNVYAFQNMFAGCKALTTLDDIDHITFNITKYKNTGSGRSGDEHIIVDAMFANSGLVEIDVSHWATTPIQSYRSLFLDCDKLKNVNVNGIVKASTVDPLTGNTVVATTNLYNMFFGCSSLGTDSDHPFDVSSFDTENVTDMAYMFEGCSGLKSIDVSNFNTSNVTNMSYMFDECSGLTVLDISNFNTGNVTNMSWMFAKCDNLTTIKVGENWSTSSLGSYDYMKENLFKNDYNLIGNDGTLCDMSKYSQTTYVKDYTFAHANEGGYLTTGDYKIFYDTDADDDEYTLTAANELDIKEGTATASYAGGAVVNLPTLKVREEGDPFKYWLRTTQNASGNIVFGDDAITSIANDEVGNRIYSAKWTLAKEKYAVYDDNNKTLTFYFDANKADKTGAYSLNEADWQEHSAEIEYVEFDDDVTELKPTSCYQWFKGCTKLKSLDLRKLNTKNTTNMESMFEDCSSLTGILIGDNWSTDRVSNEDSKNMFKGCSSLIGEYGYWVDSEYLDKTCANVEDHDYYSGYLTKDNFKVFYDLDDYDDNGSNAIFVDDNGDKVDLNYPVKYLDENAEVPNPTWENGRYGFIGWNKAIGYDNYAPNAEKDLTINAASGNYWLKAQWGIFSASYEYKYTETGSDVVHTDYVTLGFNTFEDALNDANYPVVATTPTADGKTITSVGTITITQVADYSNTPANADNYINIIVKTHKFYVDLNSENKNGEFKNYKLIAQGKDAAIELSALNGDPDDASEPKTLFDKVGLFTSGADGSYGSLTIDGGNYNLTDANNIGCNGGGTITIKDGNFEGNGSEHYTMIFLNTEGELGHIEISGGTFIEDDVILKIGSDGGTATITGGTFTGNKYGVEVDGGSLTITGGTISGYYGIYKPATSVGIVNLSSADDANPTTISGYTSAVCNGQQGSTVFQDAFGYFTDATTQIPEHYTESGDLVSGADDNLTKVTDVIIKSVSPIFTASYKVEGVEATQDFVSLKAALDESNYPAGCDGEITITQNADYTDKLYGKKEVAISNYSFTLDMTDYTTDVSKYLIEVANANASLAINGDNDKTNFDASNIMVSDNASLSISGGSFKNDNTVLDVASTAGEVSLSGGKFEGGITNAKTDAEGKSVSLLAANRHFYSSTRKVEESYSSSALSNTTNDPLTVLQAVEITTDKVAALIDLAKTYDKGSWANAKDGSYYNAIESTNRALTGSTYLMYVNKDVTPNETLYFAITSATYQKESEATEATGVADAAKILVTLGDGIYTKDASNNLTKVPNYVFATSTTYPLNDDGKTFTITDGVAITPYDLTSKLPADFADLTDSDNKPIITTTKPFDGTSTATISEGKNTITVTGVGTGTNAETVTVTISAADFAKSATKKVSDAGTDYGMLVTFTLPTTATNYTFVETGTDDEGNPTTTNVKEITKFYAAGDVAGEIQSVYSITLPDGWTATPTTATAGTTVTLTYSGSKTVKAVKVYPMPKSISIDTPETTTLTAKGTLTLTATISPATIADEDKVVTWTSSKTEVATVSEDGEVTGVATGEATITAETVNGKTATITINVE